jgi:hypothetical protein
MDAAYLNATVAAPLAEALELVARFQPGDPVGALAHLLYRRHRLYRPGALARAGGPPALARMRLRAEHAKARLDSMGTVWFIMGALWLFGSENCSASAPKLTDLAATWMLLGFASLFAPVVFFGALCCCLPPALALLNAYGHVLGLRGADGAASGADDPHAWIDALPVLTFVPAPPPEEDVESAEAGAAAGGVGAEGTDAAEGSPRCAPERPASACSARSDGSGGAPVGGLLGKRYVAAEDAACAVCLGAYGSASGGGEGSRVALLPCGHHFHAPCIATWLRVNASCPLCKAALGPRAQADGDEDPHEVREAYLRAAVRGGDDLLSVLV